MIKELNYVDIVENRESIEELLKICFRSTYGRDVKQVVIDEKYNSLAVHVKAENAYVFGCFDEEKLIGFMWGYPVITPFETVFHIAYIALFEYGRRKGIGSKLLYEAEKQAVELGIDRIELIVGATNDKAEEFYKKAGYQTCRNVMAKSIK